jgi:hypothetical protein
MEDTMRTTTLVIASLVLGATALPAQARRVTPELRPFVGVSIPTGAQRDLFGEAPLLGLGGAVQLRPNLHLVGTFAWVPGQTEYAVTEDNVNIFQYDVGVELSVERAMGSWMFRPFLGLGGGARTYAFKSALLDNKTCAAGYAALGSEFMLGATAVRLEARDNLFCYRSPIEGEESRTRNDIGVSLGLSYHFR